MRAQRADILKFLREVLEVDIDPENLRVSDQVKAAEIICKMCEFNGPEKKESNTA
jgi:hypothetical protein